MSSSMSTNFTSLPFDPKQHTFVPTKFNEASKPSFLKSVIQRARTQLEQTTLSLTIHGIYSLPEVWKSRMVITVSFI